MVFFLLALTVMVLIVMGSAWYLLTQVTAAPPSAAEVESGFDLSPSTLERTFLGLYLNFHKDEVEAPASNSDQPLPFSVQPGDTAATIATRLQQVGLIRDAELFRLLVRYRGVGGQLEVGDYLLRPNMTMDEIIEALQHGQLPTVTVTIPEGWRAEETAAFLQEQGLADADQFMALVQAGGFDYNFLQNRPVGSSPSLEGYLFPETYEVPVDIDAAGFIDLMLRTFDQRFTLQMRQEAAARDLTIHQVVNLAAIVEKEAVLAEERALIAAVFLNRLEQGMFLNADPTVQYALGYQADTGLWWKRPLLLVDLEFESPYNTYRHTGLPPGPICNPGLASLKAVLEAPETDYLFFVSKGDGSHAFAKTLEEHNQNVELYQPRD
ncbi:MAG: endolytic transglycosylase MltG [Anaerolineae bacterium]